MQRLTAAGSCGPTPIACDEAVTDTINDPIESDLIRFGFSVAEGEVVSINVDDIAPEGGAAETVLGLSQDFAPMVEAPGVFMKATRANSPRAAMG